MVLYHGSRAIYDELQGDEPGYSGSLGYGLYLTPDPNFARHFGKHVHRVLSPVPDALVADLSADGAHMWTYDCGDSLVLGTPGAVPFTFELRDRATGEVRRYSVLENCDYAVTYQLRDEYIEDHVEAEVPGLEDLEGDEEVAYASALWEDMLRRVREDSEASPTGAMEDAIEDGFHWADAEEVPAWAASVEERMLDAAQDFEDALQAYMDRRLGTEIDLDDIASEVRAAGYAAFYLDGYSPGAGEYVIVSEDYLPVPVLGLLEE